MPSVTYFYRFMLGPTCSSLWQLLNRSSTWKSMVGLLELGQLYEYGSCYSSTFMRSQTLSKQSRQLLMRWGEEVTDSTEASMVFIIYLSTRDWVAIFSSSCSSPRCRFLSNTSQTNSAQTWKLLQSSLPRIYFITIFTTSILKPRYFLSSPSFIIFAIEYDTLGKLVSSIIFFIIYGFSWKNMKTWSGLTRTTVLKTLIIQLTQFSSGLVSFKYDNKSIRYRYFLLNSFVSFCSFEGVRSVMVSSPVAQLETISSRISSSSSEQHLIRGCVQSRTKRSAMLSLSEVRISEAMWEILRISMFSCLCMGVLIPSVIIIFVNYSLCLQNSTKVPSLYLI